MSKSTEIKIDILAMAKLFKDQCVGQYGGHMGNIPNNPTIRSVFIACGYHTGYDTDEQFAEVLQAFAAALANQPKSF